VTDVTINKVSDEVDLSFGPVLSLKGAACGRQELALARAVDSCDHVESRGNRDLRILKDPLAPNSNANQFGSHLNLRDVTFRFPGWLG
jgi:hypothetical protein